MKNTDIYRAVGDIDEEFISGAEKRFDKQNRRGYLYKALKIVGYAASFAFIIGFALFMWITAQTHKDPPASSDTAAVTAAVTGKETDAPRTEDASQTTGTETETEAPAEIKPYAEYKDGKFTLTSDETLNGILSSAVLPDFENIIEAKAFIVRKTNGMPYVVFRVAFIEDTAGTFARCIYMDALDEGGTVLDSIILGGHAAVFMDRGTGADGRSEDPCFNVVYISQLYNDHGETVSALNAKCYSLAHHYYFGIEEGAESEAFVRFRGSDPDTDWSYNGDITLGKGSAAFFPGFVKKLANFIKSYGTAVTAGSTMPEKRYMLAETFSGRGGVYAPDERQNAYEAYKAASEITQGALYEEYIGLSAIRREKYAADSAEVFTVNGVVAAVSAEGKYGLYSRSGEQLAPFVYDNAEKYETYTDMILLYRDGMKFLYKTGFYFDGESNVRYGILFSENKGFDDVIMLKEGLFILERNGVRFPATYLSAHPDIDCAEYRLIGNDLFYARRGNGKCGLYQVMISGLSEVYPATADEIEFYDSRKGWGKVAADLLFIREMGACALFIYRDGAALEMTDLIYDGFEVDEETGDVIGISGGGRTVVYKGLNENEYSVVKAVQTLRIVRYNRDLGYGVVDSAGNFVIPAEYGMITSVTSDRFFCSKIKGEDGVIIDGKGKTVASGFRFVYSLSAPDKKNTLYTVETEGGDVALIDKNGNIKKFDFAVRSVEYGLNDFYYINDAVGYDAKRDVIIEDLTGKR